MQNLTAKAATTEMFSADWGIDPWFKTQFECQQAAQAQARDPSPDPALTSKPGPLRESMIQEFCFKAVSELYGAKALLQLTEIAPNCNDFDYLVTQVLDEARHARLFRQHLVSIGFAPSSEIEQQMAISTADAIPQIIEPLRDYFEKWVLHRKDFVAGASIITIVLEGVLAPSAELGELKWRPFDRAAADLQALANADELRHLAVCASIVKQGIATDASARSRVQECVNEGMALWASIPIGDEMLAREQQYQQGMEANKDRIANYRLAPGMLLSESTPESRIALAKEWTHEMQTSRVKYMGIF
jgi:hypothetical protein